jgi:hypothetical protein
MYRLLAVGSVLCMLTTFAFAATAEKRVALVIGNSNYTHAPKLPNPVNDATAVAILLRNVGFDVVVRQDLNINDMRRVVRDFSEVTRDAGIAIVFYAGHGLELNGNNYLVPADAVLERDIDVEDETLPLERVLNILEPAKRLRLIILDACRDNPFARTMKRSLTSRAIGRGLARIEPMTSGTLIAFAAKAGSVAADGSGLHSPFTSALLDHIATPGLDLRIAFGRIRDEVLKSTANKQEPFVYGSLGGANTALVQPAEGGLPIPTSVENEARVEYELASQIGTKDAWDVFLRTHQTGLYADLARAQQAKLQELTNAKSETKLHSEEKKKAALATIPPVEDFEKKAGSSDRSLVDCCIAYCRLVKCNAPSLPKACSAETFAAYYRMGMSAEAQRKNYLDGARAYIGGTVSLPACR